MHGFVPILFLMVVLKIPVGLLLYLVWWASRAEPLAEQEAPPDGGDHRFRRFRRQPDRPRGPRRGGHGPDAVPLPDCPPGGRARVVSAPAPVRASGARGARRDAADPAR